MTARKRGFLIPLSEKTLREGMPKKEVLQERESQERESQEGLYIETATDTETQVNSETAAIYFVPR